jgi:hypothetical protein
MPSSTTIGSNKIQPPAFSKVAKSKASNVHSVTKPKRVMDDQQNVRVVGEKKDYIA